MTAAPAFKRWAWALLGLALLHGALAAPVIVEGQRFDDTAQLAGTPLLLNGVGMRAVLWIHAFAAGLYVRQPGTDPQRILDDPGSKRVRVKMLMNIPTDELVKALRNGLRKNTTPEEYAQMGPRMDQIEARLRTIESTRTGDTLDLDWHAGSGLMLVFNGQARGSTPIAGYDLYRGLLKIFIGGGAIDKRLRAGMLAGAASGPKS